MESQPPLRSASQRAIQQALTAEIGERAAGLWDAPAVSLVPIPAVQNFVYAVDSPNGPAILRLTHESHRSAAEVNAELRWIIDLAGRGLSVAPPRKSHSGALVENIESTHGRFLATCFERAPGAAPDPANSRQRNERLFENLGTLIGQLHNAARAAAWTKRSLPRRSWREESVVRKFGNYVPPAEPLVHRAFDRTLSELDALPRSRESYGMIHADLNQANFFVEQNRLTAFDFDDSCFCWFAYDLAVVIYHLPADETQKIARGQAESVLRALLRGYERVASFAPVWLQWIPLFLKWRDLLIYGLFYEQLEITALPKRFEKTFLAMRERIESGQPIADISGGG